MNATLSGGEGSVPPGGPLSLARSGDRKVRLIAGTILGLCVCVCVGACVATLGAVIVLPAVLSGVRSAPEFTLYVQNQDCTQKQPSLPSNGLRSMYQTSFEISCGQAEGSFVFFTRHTDASKKELAEHYGLLS